MNTGCLYSQQIQTQAPSPVTNNDDYCSSSGFMTCLKGSGKPHYLELSFNSMLGSQDLLGQQRKGCVCGLGICYNNIMVTKMSTMVYKPTITAMFIAEQSHPRPDSKPVGSILQQVLGATWTRHHLLLTFSAHCVQGVWTFSPQELLSKKGLKL